MLKVVSAQILHKLDIGGVMLSVGSDAALQKSYARLVENVRKAAPDIAKPRVLVQKMMPAAPNSCWGPSATSCSARWSCSPRGIYVEVLKRVGFRLAPFEVDQARELIYNTLPAKMIAGARGRKRMNVDAIAETLVSLGRLLKEYPQIEQVDSIPARPLKTAAWRSTRASFCRKNKSRASLARVLF